MGHKKNKKCAIISFNPVELYPPLMNLLRDNRWNSGKTYLFTTRENKGRKEFVAPGIKITRTKDHWSVSAMINLWDKLTFSFTTFFHLLFFHPDVIFYIESTSALPVWLYAKLNRKCRIFIHYYEYTSPKQFADSRWFSFCHKFEKYLYKRCEWLSQCNSKRLEFFLTDTGCEPSKGRVFPNYPPKSWTGRGRDLKKPFSKPLKLILVGSLSRKNMYIENLVNFLSKHPDKFFLDIYSYNCSSDCQNFLKHIDAANIRFFPQGVEYDDLPELLSQYDVGLLIYRARGLNVQFCEPNKYYEYLCCGLDVWFPPSMKLLRTMVQENTSPRTIMIDMENLDGELEKLYSLYKRPECVAINKYAENAADKLFEQLKIKG